MDTIEQIEAQQVASMTEGKNIPDFSPGDTLRVNVKVIEGNRERLQAFEGVCIGRRNAGLNSSFTVRKISYGEGVERVFPLFSPKVESIAVVRRGKVRRAKLYYLRGRRGKAARIAERTTGRATADQDFQAKKGAPSPERAQAASAADMSEEELQAAAAPVETPNEETETTADKGRKAEG